MTDNAVKVRDLTKSFGDFEAVRGISFEVKSGETFGFLGPNGAGKSTTISILCTLLAPTSGLAEVAGFDVATQRDQVRRNIGLVFQETTLDVYLSATQNLEFHAELYGVPRDLVAPRMRQVLEMVDLWDRRDSLVETFSGGMKRRLEIARGLMHSPRVLFLDEPTVGLDPQTRSSIWKYMYELRDEEDITIFLTTHYMDEADHCDRIAIMDEGQIVAIDSPTALKAQVGLDTVLIGTNDDNRALALLKDDFQIEATLTDGLVRFGVPDGESFVPKLFNTSIEINSVSVAKPSLDDVFMEFTGNTIRDAETSSKRGMGVSSMPGPKALGRR
ncbi:MAG: ATP-binding cassette domain-containing protein [Candidatus Nanopelagicales bacterium]